jgi:hypothetical protein
MEMAGLIKALRSVELEKRLDQPDLGFPASFAGILYQG